MISRIGDALRSSRCGIIFVIPWRGHWEPQTVNPSTHCDSVVLLVHGWSDLPLLEQANIGTCGCMWLCGAGACNCQGVRVPWRAAARVPEASQRHTRGIPEAYQRHTRGKPRGKPLFSGKIHVTRGCAMKNY